MKRNHYHRFYYFYLYKKQQTTKAIIYKSIESYRDLAFAFSSFIIFSILALVVLYTNHYIKSHVIVFIAIPFIFMVAIVIRFFISPNAKQFPQIILDTEEITFTEDDCSFLWKDIEFYHIYQENSVIQITIKTKEKTHIIDLEDLEISKKELNMYLKNFYIQYSGKNVNRNFKTIVQRANTNKIIDLKPYLDNTIL